jgi:hypothetical protein
MTLPCMAKAILTLTLRLLNTDKRLIFLFIKDLMDGVNGAILDLKDRRDTEARRKVSYWAKVASWVFLGTVACGILFFIYLFGVQQTKSRQTAWFKSFVVWIALEVLLVSSAIVFVQHVLVPLLTLKDVRRVQERVVRDIVSFNAKMKKTNRKITAKQQSFNAASYLFPSYRLAATYTSLKESAVITQYHTSFPKKAFSSGKSRSNNIKKSYDLRFAFLKQAFSRLAIFAITSMIQLPPPVQDALTEVASSVGFGYIGMLHVRLYRMRPVLAFAPLAAAVLTVHFLTASGRANTRLDLTKTVPVDEDTDDEVPADVAKSKTTNIKSAKFDSSSSESKDNNEKTHGAIDLSQPQVAPLPSWKSRRASAVESLGLAHSLAQRHALHSLSSVHPETLQEDWAEEDGGGNSSTSHSDSGNVVEMECDELGEPVVRWEEDDGMEPDGAANRKFFRGMWSDSDNSENEDFEDIWAIGVEDEQGVGDTTVKVISSSAAATYSSDNGIVNGGIKDARRESMDSPPSQSRAVLSATSSPMNNITQVKSSGKMLGSDIAALLGSDSNSDSDNKDMETTGVDNEQAISRYVAAAAQITYSSDDGSDERQIGSRDVKGGSADFPQQQAATAAYPSSIQNQRSGAILGSQLAEMLWGSSEEEEDEYDALRPISEENGDGKDDMIGASDDSNDPDNSRRGGCVDDCDDDDVIMEVTCAAERAWFDEGGDNQEDSIMEWAGESSN